MYCRPCQLRQHHTDDSRARRRKFRLHGDGSSGGRRRRLPSVARRPSALLGQAPARGGPEEAAAQGGT